MILLGDVRQTLPTLPDRSVQTCITSPPYFGLRDYGCDGQIGLEPTPREFVDTMVQVFREVRRVLRDDGTLWLNLGDSYAGARGGTQGQTGQCADRTAAAQNVRFRAETRMPEGFKPKDLMGIPWRVAFALQDDGWYLRQDIIWSKPNPMPESVRDRCTKAHEYLFLLSKSARYYFDADAIAEPATGEAPGNKAPTKGGREYEDGAIEHRTAANLHHIGARDTRNKRSVWTIPTQPMREAHFATFPEALVEPCIRAGSRPGDTVLDPFLGAGTTALVAEREGRQWIGCELNPDYAAIAERRLRGVQKPLNLRGAA
jgi:DNA modification methylase